MKKVASDFFSPDLNRKYGIRIRGSHVKSFGLNNYRTTRAENFVNFTNVKIFKYDVIYGNGGYKP